MRKLNKITITGSYRISAGSLIIIEKSETNLTAIRYGLTKLDDNILILKTKKTNLTFTRKIRK